MPQSTRFGRKRGNATKRSSGEYRLSESAKRDLIAIAQYGDEHFGVSQSNRYRDQLKHRFSELAARPQLYPAVDQIQPGYRRSVCGAHSIYYRIEARDVEIVRILKHQNPCKAF